MTEGQISKVYLLDVPLENDYQNTLYFTSKEDQQTYFQSRVKHSFTDFSYQRKDSYIRVPLTFDDAYKINYVMYQNPKYSNKWFYAFVTDVKFENDEVSTIYIETDVIQTWLFDYNVKASFVEREHVTDDTKGKHTIPEGLEIGPEYVPNYLSNGGAGGNSTADYYIVVASTIVPSDPQLKSYGGMFNGVYSGVPYYIYDLNRHKDVTAMIQDIVDRHGTDAINGVFIAPKWICPSVGGGIVEDDTTTSVTKSFYVDDIQGLGVNYYEPKNNKLYSYPYCYFLATNGAGNTAIYKREMFVDKAENGKYEFEISGALTPGCSIRLEPKNYGINSAINTPITYGLSLAKFPQCNWATDMYTNWLVQNGVNVGTSVVTGAVQVVGGMALTGVPGGAIMGTSMAVGGVASITNSLYELEKAELIPPQAQGNINCGDVIYSNQDIDFRIYHMTIKEEYAKIIDDYFSMFGYKINRVKVPNKAHRSRWWYTKTLNVNIDGAIPNKDMQKIKDCYNKGITFWRNPSEIQNYSLSNGINATAGAVTDID